MFRLVLVAFLALLGACATDAPTAPGVAPGATRRLSVPVTGYTQVSAGSNHTCALTAAGAVSCWGDNSDDQLTGIPTGGGYRQVSAGVMHSCALTGTGAITCWGSNGDDAVGPLTGVPTGSGYTQVSAGATHSCALTGAGAITCWGDDYAGASTGGPTGGGHLQVDVGRDHSCALTSTGAITCWGAINPNESPAPAGTGYTQLSVGYWHACALTSTGTVSCWGDNDSGQLNGVPAGAGYTRVGVGKYHACALTSTGAITCWGGNSYGQLTGIPAGTGYTQVSAGVSHTCALGAGGAVTCWGPDNYYGQSTPPTTRVLPRAAFSAPATVTAGQAFTLALTGAQVPGGYKSTFTYQFDCGSGSYGAASGAATATCPTTAAGPRTVRGRVIDRDGDATEYTAAVTVLTPAQATQQLRDAVAASGIRADVRQGLTDKLDAALTALAAGQTGTACNQLAAFQSQVTAQRGKAVPRATADAWLAQAAQIRRALGC